MKPEPNLSPHLLEFSCCPTWCPTGSHIHVAICSVLGSMPNGTWHMPLRHWASSPAFSLTLVCHNRLKIDSSVDTQKCEPAWLLSLPRTLVKEGPQIFYNSENKMVSTSENFWGFFPGRWQKANPSLIVHQDGHCYGRMDFGWAFRRSIEPDHTGSTNFPNKHPFH